MKRSFNPAQVPQAIALESVQVASPCHADWEAMHGNDRSRFCPSCAKNVYNLSAMTRDEAELLLQEKEGRLCVRFYVREDGTMLTQDCPVGVAALKQRSPSFALWAGVASLFVLVGALLSPSLISGANAQPETPSGADPTQTVAPTPESPAMMGDIAIPVVPTAVPVQESANLATLGEARAVPATQSQATPQPTCAPVMGKPAPPVQPRALLGRVAAPKPTPVPQATPTPAPPVVPGPMMGLVAPPTRPTAPKKEARPAQKPKSSKPNQG